MPFTKRPFQMGPKRRHGAAQRRHVGVQPRQVRCAQFDIAGGAQRQQDGAHWHGAQLDHRQHLLAPNAGTVERHDLGPVAPAAQSRQFRGPEGGLMTGVLIDAAQAAHHAQPLLGFASLLGPGSTAQASHQGAGQEGGGPAQGIANLAGGHGCSSVSLA